MLSIGLCSAYPVYREYSYSLGIVLANGSGLCTFSDDVLATADANEVARS